MKKLKTILLIAIGYIIFILIAAGFESIVVAQLGMNTLILDNLKENIKYTLMIYIILNILFWGINYILNFQTVKKLNNTLNIIRKKGEENEK